MNVPEFPYIVYLPAAQPSPPPGSPIESPPLSPKEIDPILDTPQELEKWIAARKKSFPSKRRIAETEAGEVVKAERGDLSKLEIRMRKRMALMKRFYKKTEDKPGRNPFLKYLHIRKKLTNNTVLKEQRVMLQCIKFVVSNNFFTNEITKNE